eukprot:XP_001706254.1 Hypothetical protein GL50803_19078 [Giardia lamblia ATCC 50803]
MHKHIQSFTLLLLLCLVSLELIGCVRPSNLGSSKVEVLNDPSPSCERGTCGAEIPPTVKAETVRSGHASLRTFPTRKMRFAIISGGSFVDPTKQFSTFPPLKCSMVMENSDGRTFLLSKR